MIKAIWIDAEHEDLNEVEIEGSTLEAMQECVGGNIEFALNFPNGDTLFVNESGLLNVSITTPFQVWEQEERCFAGNGIIVGTTEDGDTASCASTIEEITAAVSVTGPVGASMWTKVWASRAK